MSIPEIKRQIEIIDNKIVEVSILISQLNNSLYDYYYKLDKLENKRNELVEKITELNKKIAELRDSKIDELINE